MVIEKWVVGSLGYWAAAFCRMWAARTLHRFRSQTAAAPWAPSVFITARSNSHGVEARQVAPRGSMDLLGQRHSVQMSLACVLSLAIFWVLLQSWELFLVLGIVRYLVLCPWR